MLDLLRALTHLDANNLTHCDVKMSNVMVCDNLTAANETMTGQQRFPTLKLGDFGLAFRHDTVSYFIILNNLLVQN